MLRIRNIRMENYDQPSVELDEFSTELCEDDFGNISNLLAVLADELAEDHYRFKIVRGDVITLTGYD